MARKRMRGFGKKNFLVEKKSFIKENRMKKKNISTDNISLNIKVISINKS
jgi:hypothetical protein